MARVVLLRCNSYDREEVYTVVKRGMELLGGIDRFIPTDSKRILLKPNLLAPDPPEKASTTHPSVFYAIARYLLDNGYSPVYGDSPIIGMGHLAARVNGIKKVAEELGIGYVPFKNGIEIDVPEATQMKRFTIAEDVVNTDVLVNIPKLKTHGLARITGALKNLFGVIPGILKPELHVQIPDPVLFARMLVDLNIAVEKLVKSSFVVMDAVYAMEGNGPRNGSPVKTGLLIFADNAAAADAVGAVIMGMNPKDIPILREAEALGIGEISPDRMDILGDPLSDFTGYTFELPPETLGENGESFLYRFARNSVVPRPVIDDNKCTRCGICVNVCPVKPKALSQRGKGKNREVPEYDYSLCIRCYCCQESCPEGAISIKVPFLGKVLHKFNTKINF